MIKNLIDSALVIETLSARTKEEAFDEILSALVDAGSLGKRKVSKIRKGLLEREERGSTGIGNGVAVPHVKSSSIDAFTLVLARSTEGLPYQAVDGRDVNTVFFVLAPENKADEHLQVLRWVSGLARNADFRRFVKNAGSGEEIRDLLHEMSSAP